MQEKAKFSSCLIPQSSVTTTSYLSLQISLISSSESNMRISNFAWENSYGKLYLSPLFALSIGSGFARFTETLTHVALFNGRDMWRQTRSAVKTTKLDIHAKLMRNYKQVPEWWFYALLEPVYTQQNVCLLCL